MLGKFNLQTSFVGAGAPGKDIQNQSYTVDNLYVKLFFQVLLLVRRQLIIENEDIKVTGVL